MTQSTVPATVQTPDPGAVITLFHLDANNVGAGDFRFTSTAFTTSKVMYGGQTYEPVDIFAEGFEWSGKGSLPEPTLRLNNATFVLMGAVIAYNDLLGAKLTRIRTFRQFLDGQADADPNAHLPTEIYYIAQKTAANKIYIEWKLASSLDQEGSLLPGRQVLKDVCTHRYRRWTGNQFDYTLATCPYAGTNYYDKDGVQVFTGDADSCGKKLSDCQLRFGASNELPTRAFPGVAVVPR